MNESKKTYPTALREGSKVEAISSPLSRLMKAVSRYVEVNRF